MSIYSNHSSCNLLQLTDLINILLQLDLPSPITSTLARNTSHETSVIEEDLNFRSLANLLAADLLGHGQMRAQLE
ncbi:transcriptional regulatory protein Dep1 [Aspergillus luchuensis]|uniref:Transcriptional regulatory protein Dep1 n=1 Tax=Aspergillus kawachii TaxID=1069201 RepID=A0A146FVY6_ASPKA|nr:transcriptional regulatory protein Dep1 [Aspergillus luchuensis]